MTSSLQCRSDGVDVHVEFVRELLDEERCGRVGCSVPLGLDLGLDFGEFLGSRGRHDLPTPAAHRFVARDVVTTPRTGDGCDAVGFVTLRDIHPVDTRELSVGVAPEDSDVTGGSSGASNPAVVVLDVGLIQIPGREERRTGLPEVRERDGACDLGTGRGFLVDLQDHLVAKVVDGVELRPQGSIPVASLCWMVVEPVVQVWDARDKRDRPAALLAFDGGLEAVFMVFDVADGEGLELAAAEAAVELDGDHRRIAWVVRRVDHRKDVFVPVQHLSGVGRRVVVRRRPRRDPGERRRQTVTVCVDVFASVRDPLPEDAERSPVIPVGLLVVELAVDPRDDGLRSLLVLEGVCQPAVTFGDEDAVAEEFLVAEVAVGLRQEIETVAERDEGVAILFADVAGVFGSLPEIVDVLSDVANHAYHGGTPSRLSCCAEALNLRLETLHRLDSQGSEPLTASNGRIGNANAGPVGYRAVAGCGGVAA